MKKSNRKLDAFLALIAALFLAAAASAGGKQSAPIRLLFAVVSVGGAGVAIEWLSKLDREDALSQQREAIELERQQVYAQADLEADRTVAHFRAADRLFQENPELVDYFAPTVNVNAEPIDSDSPTESDQDGGTVAMLTPDGLFDWSVLQDADEHPILAIIGPMGSGKSRVAKYLAKHVLYPDEVPELTIYDIYARIKDWQGATVVSDPTVMIAAMKSQIKTIEENVRAYRSGQTDFQPRFTIFEEAPGTLPTLKAIKNNPVDNWILQYTTVTRKVRDRLCLISVRAGGAAIGTGAEARDDCTIIFAGTRGVDKAFKDTSILKLGTKQNQGLRDRLRGQIKGLKHPALIYRDGTWTAGSIPELDEHGNPIDSTPKAIAPAPEQESEVSALPHELKPIAAYIEERGTVSLRALKKNFGRNHGFNAEAIEHQIDMLLEWMLVDVDGDRIVWIVEE